MLVLLADFTIFFYVGFSHFLEYTSARQIYTSFRIPWDSPQKEIENSIQNYFACNFAHFFVVI